MAADEAPSSDMASRRAPAAAALPPAKPRLAWRVGVTGHRDFDAATIDALRPAVAEVLALVRRTLHELASTQAVADVHAPGADADLRLLSPLAEGADRLVAAEALRQGYRLEVALPFPQAQYEQDFDPDSVAAFQALLAEARDEAGGPGVVALDGTQGPARHRSYAAVGRFVARNCDLLIAIWDGQRVARRGGTESVVRAAAAAGVPVWWIDPDRPRAPCLLQQDGAVRDGPAAHDGAAAAEALRHAMRLSLVPPGAGLPAADGLLRGIVQRLFGATRGAMSPLRDYLREAPPRAPRLRQVHARFIDLVVGEPSRPIPPALGPEGPVEQWWERHHAAAAAASKAFGDRYRSSYVIVFLMAGIALIAAILAFVVPAALHVPVALVELAMLVSIAMIVCVNHLGRWQERWITYRLLAELCRKQRVLAPLGLAPPVGDVARIVTARGHGHDPAGGGEAALPPRDAWVAWYFAALRRTAPLPAGDLSGAALARARDHGRGVFEEQLAYHRRRRRRSEAASHHLAQWGEAFFLFALAGVVARIALELMHAPALAVTLVGVACAASPAVSATLLGIRAYAEFELIARQSERMERVMSDAIAELDSLPTDGALASEALGSALIGVSTSMLLDIDGWAQLFHVKALEAG